MATVRKVSEETIERVLKAMPGTINQLVAKTGLSYTGVWRAVEFLRSYEPKACWIIGWVQKPGTRGRWSMNERVYGLTGSVDVKKPPHIKATPKPKAEPAPKVKLPKPHPLNAMFGK